MATPVAPVRQEPFPKRVVHFYHDVVAELEVADRALQLLAGGNRKE